MERTVDADGVMTRSAPDIDALDDWESLAEAGRLEFQSQDKSRWTLGHIASRVEKCYGKSTIKKLAADIGIPKHHTLYAYEEVFTFYQGYSTHEDYPSLSWSHFRAAMRAKDPDEAVDWLSAAADNNWPVAKLEQEIRKSLGEEVIVRHRFDVAPAQVSSETITVSAAPDETLRFADLLQLLDAHPDFLMQIVVQWTEREPELKTTPVG